jgi:hypothetical protein
MNFLPTDYKCPSTSMGYMKIQDGENKIRILTSPILGWEDWEDKKPIRFAMDKKPLASIDPKKPVRHFWAFVVWNYKDRLIQILEITQASIRKRIQDFSVDPDWGAPFHYDLKIIRKGEGVDTEYVINPVSHKEIDPAIIEEFHRIPILLEALYTGEDPFALATEKRRSVAYFEMEKKPSTPPSVRLISSEQEKFLEAMLGESGSEYKGTILGIFKGSKSFSEIPASAFDSIVFMINEHKKTIAVPKTDITEDEIPF